MCLGFLTVPRKVHFAVFHCTGLIGNYANIPLDYGKVLTKSRDMAACPLWEDRVGVIPRKGDRSYTWASAKRCWAALWKAAEPERWGVRAFLELKHQN